MRTNLRRPPLASLALLAGCLLVNLPATASAQQDAGDLARLTEHLQIRPGMQVAEIGAGTGSLTVSLAQAVGPAGHVFSNEINRDRHAAIRSAVKKAGLSNVTVVESGAADANLPAACCDAVFMRNVYHHFDDPGAMNASLFRAMKPGARIAIIDFPPRGGKEAATPRDRDQGNAHGGDHGEHRAGAAGCRLRAGHDGAAAWRPLVHGGGPQAVSLTAPPYLSVCGGTRSGRRRPVS